MAKRKKSDNPDADKKKIFLEQIPLPTQKHGVGGGPHAMLKKLISAYHKHLEDARIALFWNTAKPREDADGTASIGKTFRANDIFRDCSEFDFVIVLSHVVFNQSDEPTREAMLDELLCPCMRVTDRHGEPKIDTKDRFVWRLRKPDIVTFSEILARRGPYKKCLKNLPGLLADYKDSQRGLLKLAEGTDGEKKHRSIHNPGGGTEPANTKAKTGATNGNGHGTGHAKKHRTAAAPDK